MPVRKKVAWDDLGIARRIYADHAIVLDDGQSPTRDVESADVASAVGRNSKVSNTTTVGVLSNHPGTSVMGGMDDTNNEIHA